MAALDSARLGGLFRQWAQISDELQHAQRLAERLTLDHNSLVREGRPGAAGGW